MALLSPDLDCGCSAEFKMLGQVEGNDDSVMVKVYIAFGRVHVFARLGMCISERTTARIRRHADKEHNEQDQNIRMQWNLCMLVDCSAFIYVCVCFSVYLCAQAHECMGCRPACVATLQYSHIVLRRQNRDPVADVMVAVF